MDLERLNKALSTYEVAEHIYKVDNGKTLSEALSLLEAANETSAVDAEEQDFLKREPAMKHHIRGGGKIELNKNKSKISFNGRPVKRTSTFKAVVDGPDDFKKTVAEDRGELPWIRSASQLQLSENAVKILKNAVARKQAIDKACREEAAQRAVSNVKSRILQKHEIEEALTPAQKTIEVPKSRLLDQLPPGWNPDKPAVDGREFTTAQRLPDEWKDAKERARANQKAGQLRTWNDAQDSLKRQPNKETSPLDGDIDWYDKNKNLPQVDGMTRTELPQPATIKNSDKMSRTPKGQAKTRAPQWDVNLKSPKKPAEQFNPIDGAV